MTVTPSDSGFASPVLTARAFLMGKRAEQVVGCSMIREYRLNPDETFHLICACIEFGCAALELLCVTVLSVPIPRYNAKLRELRDKREIQE